AAGGETRGKQLQRAAPVAAGRSPRQWRRREGPDLRIQTERDLSGAGGVAQVRASGDHLSIERPVLAVIPFGARDATSIDAAVARQISRRLVERFERSGVLDAKPVYLVAVDDTSGAGAVVLG